jgi:predicted branched-subunit amino acid permease
MNKNSSQWRVGLTDGIPIAIGYLAVSFTFGIMAKNSGLSPFQATLMSFSNLTSAGQFAGLGLIAASAPYWEMAVTQLVINLRYCLMSCALSQKLGRETPLAHRYLVAFGITDEIFGVSVCKKGELSPFYTYGVISVACPSWALGTFIGVVSGGILRQKLMSALSVALYGMFLAVIIPHARSDRVLSVLIPASMLSSLLFAKIPALSQFSPGFKIICLTVLIAGAAAILRPIEASEKDSGEERDER